MTPLRTLVRTAAVAALLASCGTARAGWSNVFQVCCDSCRTRVAAASPVGACCPAPDPCQQCTTRYVQRCFYQPVTTFQQRTFLEPVTTYRTSFYWEPVTSFRVSNYFDPCTCSCQQVATPVTSFRLRSQCCPVTSYCQKTVLQPVQSYQLSYYWEPHTTCCQTTIGAPVMSLPAGAATVPAVPATPVVPANPAVPASPGVTEQRQPQLAVPPGVSEQREPAPGSTESQRYPAPASSPPMPRAPEGATYRPAPAAPSVRLDRIVSLAPPNLEGQVIGADRLPVANARVLFIHADRVTTREAVTADAHGKFQVTLASGTWLVYTQTVDGKTNFRQKVEVRADEPTALRLVSR